MQSLNSNNSITEFHPLVSNFGTWANRPTNPSGGQTYFATDRSDTGILYVWDATLSQWLSAQKYTLSLSTRDTATYTQATHLWGTVFEDYDVSGGNGIYLLNYRAGFVPSSAAQSSSNYYTLTLALQSTAGSQTVLTGLTGLTDTKTFTTSGRWWAMKTGINQAYSTSQFQFEAQLAPTGIPGTFLYYSEISYQIIG